MIFFFIQKQYQRRKTTNADQNTATAAPPRRQNLLLLVRVGSSSPFESNQTALTATGNANSNEAEVVPPATSYGGPLWKSDGKNGFFFFFLVSSLWVHRNRKHLIRGWAVEVSRWKLYCFPTLSPRQFLSKFTDKFRGERLNHSLVCLGFNIIATCL